MKFILFSTKYLYNVTFNSDIILTRHILIATCVMYISGHFEREKVLKSIFFSLCLSSDF